MSAPTSDAAWCTACGEQLGSYRIWIDGNSYHARCVPQPAQPERAQVEVRCAACGHLIENDTIDCMAPGCMCVSSHRLTSPPPPAAPAEQPAAEHELEDTIPGTPRDAELLALEIRDLLAARPRQPSSIHAYAALLSSTLIYVERASQPAPAEDGAERQGPVLAIDVEELCEHVDAAFKMNNLAYALGIIRAALTRPPAAGSAADAGLRSAVRRALASIGVHNCAGDEACEVCGVVLAEILATRPEGAQATLATLHREIVGREPCTDPVGCIRSKVADLRAQASEANTSGAKE